MLERKTGFGPEEEASPVNWASVFQEASNLLPPDDYGPPQPPQPNQPPSVIAHPQSRPGPLPPSECFIKTRTGIIATPRGTVTTVTAMGTSQEENLNDSTPDKSRYKKILRSYLCCCNDNKSK
ncbi:hypothetical protein ABMA27_008271 [Loxostege sticticalis]|uniref:Uncharacterized protein n=1 Tax=Loxostege sticticalis TaxID=481309 RepID=A0ABR3HAP1_LOXSC